MRRKAIWKDFFMEIKKSYNRFLSIFFIVALGVAFFAGIRATNPDMRLTADAYYDSCNLMDVRVLSTGGLTQEDVSVISGLEGVEAAEPAYSTDVLCEADGNELVLKVLSLTENINQYNIKEGRLPEKENEVLVDTDFIDATGYKIGDRINLSSGTEQKLSDTLKISSFTIVGIGSTPYYLSFQRGSSKIGNGKINSFIVVPYKVFNLDVFSTIYIEAEGAKELTSYTEAYDEKITNLVNSIKAIADDRCKTRYEELYQSASEKIATAKLELNKERANVEEKLQKTLASLQLAGLSKEELEASAGKVEAEKAKAEEKFAEAELEINASEEKLNNLKMPEWYVLDRESIEAYVEFEQNADRIGAIGEVFPVIFFLVAALISLTTMTRMVEEERIQIGVLKALGYPKVSIAMKYMLYALLATFGGSIFGAVIGLKLLPTIIITSYKILYTGIPEIITPFNIFYAVLATLLSVLCVGLSTFIACYKELLAKPANLMRPEAPKIGKRVLLERLPFIWNKLNFTRKATVRNLMRYKKRFFMTIFGIGGCMALLLVGFGLKDSIFVIYTRQFDEITIYDAAVSMENDAKENDIRELENALVDNKDIDGSMKIRNSQVDISFGKRSKSITMFVPERPEEVKEFITLRSREGHYDYELEDSGIILTEQIAKKLRVDNGDIITLQEGDIKVEAKVSQITENYLSHYLYMTPELYQKLFDKKVKYNEVLLLMPKLKEEEQLQLGNSLLTYPAANGVFYTSYYQNFLSNVLTSLNIVVWVLIVAAGALAFVVLYNLNNININERRRELATIRVLGFYNTELAAYVYRENIILTLIGTIFGSAFGILLHQYVIVTVEIDLVMFGRNIDLSSFVYSIILTFFFSTFVNFVMYYKLKKIDMVESLKSVE